ncbi:protein nessun dorma [Eurytemora carolleeae]|uniref:protein nessun dorma n=1 Tax=Eurytemora carolleeae TaxID=1294199 RepID=UPI000C76607E|nr:protein nessun dorma [Eurytemora carolleeae]|eukprot:XP_023331365.1 protein nessun dorma-like [Eurytemora affinis]
MVSSIKFYKLSHYYQFFQITKTMASKMESLERLSKNTLDYIPPVLVYNLDKETLYRKLKAILPVDLDWLNLEEAWTSFFESELEPCGWMGVWIPSFESAECHGVPGGRDGACVVDVLDVDLNQLSAEVEVLRSPEDFTKSEISVHLKELYPLAHQENEHLNIQRTAEALEVYRFFYKYLWRPWDVGTHVENWTESTLKNRIDLTFDLILQTGNCGIAQRLEKLASEAKETIAELTVLEESAAAFNQDEDDVTDDDQTDGIDLDLAGQIASLHLKTEEIKREAELLEDPVLRQVLSSSEQRKRREERTDNRPAVIIVWKNGSIKELGEVLRNIAESNPPDTPVHVVSNVQHGADILVQGDTLHIPVPGVHKLSGISNLPSGVKIQGGQSLQSSASLVNKSAALEDTTLGQSGFSEISGVEELQSTVKSETFGGCMKESSSIFEDFGGLSSKNGGEFSENPCVLSPDNVGDTLLGVDEDLELRDLVLDLPSSLSIGNSN